MQSVCKLLQSVCTETTRFLAAAESITTASLLRGCLAWWRKTATVCAGIRLRKNESRTYSPDRMQESVNQRKQTDEGKGNDEEMSLT